MSSVEVDESAPLLLDSGRSRLKQFMIMPVIFLYMQGVGFSFFIVNEWIHHYVKEEMSSGANTSVSHGCGIRNHSDPGHVLHDNMQKKTAQWQMFVSLSLLPALVALAVLPSLSDSRGRRFLLTIGISGTLWRQLCMLFIIHFRLNLVYVVIVTIIESFSGASYSFNSAVFSYVADVTNPGRQRTIGITCTEGFIMLCNTFSALIVGYCIRYLGFFPSCVISSSLGLLALLLAVCVLPETLPRQHEKVDKEREFLSSVERTVSFYRKTPETSGSQRREYALLLSAYFFTELSQNHRGAIELLYQLGLPFCWPAEKIGQFAMIRHACQGFVGPVIVAPLRAYLSDLAIAVLSAVCNCISYIVEGLAKTDLALYIVSVPVTFSFLTIPLLKSIMSTMTPKEKQGSLFAGMLLVQIVCSTINSFMLNSVYMATVSFFNGLVFLLLAVICLVAVLLMILFACTTRQGRGDINNANIGAI